MTDIDPAPEMNVRAATVRDGIVERRADLHMKRFSARSDARLRIVLDSPDAVTDVVIMDISSGGVSAAVASDLCVGSQVRLEIPLIGWRDAEVRWLADGRAGCGFLVPLSEAELLAAVVESPLIHDNFPGLVDQLCGRDILRGSVPGVALTPVMTAKLSSPAPFADNSAPPPRAPALRSPRPPDRRSSATP